MKILKPNFLSWILLTVIAMPGALLAQRNAPLMHTWKLTDGWLDQEEIHFARVDAPDDHDAWAQTFAFGENGEISYRLLLPKGRGVCGNGLLYLSEAVYKVSTRMKRLRLQVKGGHFGDDIFAYDVNYKVLRLDENEMILRRKRVRKAMAVPGYEADSHDLR